jgi:general secretion pathway protein A
MVPLTTLGQPESVGTYEPFFGLNEAPFSLAPDPRFLFSSASHAAALAQVVYALQRREPLVVITGEIGTGKTLLCRTVLQRLERKTFLSVINDPLLDRDDFMKQLLQDFGVMSRDRARLTAATRHELVQTLQAFLVSLSPLQAHAVVIIDEAQHLQPDVLEQVRLLSNVDDARGTLLQIILVGQPALEALLSRPELRQLEQRVSRRLTLKPLNRDEVEQYIVHRLSLAGGGKPPSRFPGATALAHELAEWDGTPQGVEFTPDAFHAISELSGGVPRVINLLCDRSLEAACASRLRIVDKALIQMSARALGVGARAVPAGPSITASVTRAGPDETAAIVRESEPAEPVKPIDETVLELGGSVRQDWSPRLPAYLVVATFLVLAGMAIWFGVRLARAPAATPSSAASSASRATGASAAPASANALAPEGASAAATPAPPPAGPTPSTADVAAPTGESFEIIVASFRTDARAAAVAADLTGLGVPTRSRASDGWQQVVSGPFASRREAEEARERLLRAGFEDTRVVTADR